MADTTFSVRVDNETKDKLAELAEQSGLTAKDFLIRLVTTYESSQVRESMAELKELESLRHHLARVEEIYISLVKGAQDRQEFDSAKITQALEEAQQAKAQALDAQAQAEKVNREAGERINTAEAEAALARENAQKEIQSIREALGRAEDAQEQSSRLAALAEKAAADAEAKVERLEEQAEKSEAYRQELEEIKQERGRLERDLNKAQQDLREVVGLRDAAVKAVGEEWEKKLQQALERAEFEKDKAVLDAQRQALAEMRELQDALAKCREEKAAFEIEMARLKGSTKLEVQDGDRE